MKGFRTAADNSAVLGYAGQPSAKATEVYSKYVVVDMFAKGVQGMKAEDAVKWAAGELGKIYGIARAEEANRGRIGRHRRARGDATACRGAHAPRRLTRWLENERLLATLLLRPHHPPPRALHRLPVRDGRLAAPCRASAWAIRRVRGAQELHQGVERLDLPDRVLATPASTRSGQPSSSWPSGCGWPSC